MEIVGTPLSAVNRIVATGKTQGVFNGFCGAESGNVPGVHRGAGDAAAGDRAAAGGGGEGPAADPPEPRGRAAAAGRVALSSAVPVRAVVLALCTVLLGADVSPEPARVAAARERSGAKLARALEAAGVPHPRALLLRVFKDERVLEMWAAAAPGGPFVHVGDQRSARRRAARARRRGRGTGRCRRGCTG